jgi:hypothetical protein
MRGSFSSSSEANKTHVAARSALLKQIDPVSVLSFLPYEKGLAWQCMGYWTIVIPIVEQYILLLSEACRTHFVARSALLKQMDLVSVFGFLPY